MKIGVVGAGITGLSLAELLSEKHDVELLELESSVGGIASISNVEGLPYHKVGGHCFNTKSEEVKSFVFSIFPEEGWNKIKRKSDIHMLGRSFSYPIEFSVKEIFSFKPDLALSIIEDYIAAPGCNTSVGANLEIWFRQTFGNSLTDLYFLPYNRKIWGIEPRNMNSSWVAEKLPVPNKKDFIASLLEDVQDDMVHAHFYYPKDVLNDNLIIRLANNKKIINNYEVQRVEQRHDKYVINGEREYDKVVLTCPLDIAAGMFSSATEEVTKAKSLLKYNKVTNVMWETRGTDTTWSYYPEETTIFHRHIHIGNFLRPVKNLSITETIGEVSYEDMVAEGLKFPYLVKPLAYNVSNHAYVLQDGNREYASSIVENYINKHGVYLCGRFAEWEYYNMDICIQSAMSTADKINSE